MLKLPTVPMPGLEHRGKSTEHHDLSFFNDLKEFTSFRISVES